jgi:hypothetical protein
MSKLKPQQWDMFLRALSEGWSVSKACRIAGLSRTAAYDRRARDQEFADTWDQAIRDGEELLLDEALRRAVDGITEPVVSAGKYVCDVTRYSDRLLEVLLKARLPAMFRERYDVRQTVKQEHRLDLSQLSDEELDVLQNIRGKATP